MTLDLPVAPAAVLPLDNATAVGTDTSFEWTKGEGDVTLFQVGCTTGACATQVKMVIITTGTTAHLPAIAGLVTAAGNPWTWTLESIPTFATVDDFASPRGIQDTYREVPEISFRTGLSLTRNFSHQ